MTPRTLHGRTTGRGPDEAGERRPASRAATVTPFGRSLTATVALSALTLAAAVRSRAGRGEPEGVVRRADRGGRVDRRLRPLGRRADVHREPRGRQRRRMARHHRLGVPGAAAGRSGSHAGERAFLVVRRRRADRADWIDVAAAGRHLRRGDRPGLLGPVGRGERVLGLVERAPVDRAGGGSGLPGRGGAALTLALDVAAAFDGPPREGRTTRGGQ